MKIIWKILKWFFIILVSLILLVVIAFNVSPRPAIFLINQQPMSDPVKPKHYQEYAEKVQTKKDLSYPSRYHDHEFDLFTPKNKQSKATILWVHGGGFIGGDKSGVAYWATMMASQGYTVVSMNYETAPAAHYPVPVLQMSELYHYLAKQQAKYPAINLKRLVIGGDSAGAQIASQYVAVQTNPDLAKSMKLKQQIAPDHIKATLLYCGPYDMKDLLKVKDRFARFFIKNVGWAYIGKKNFEHSSEVQEASTVNHLTKAFPPTFLTDGNTGSFEKHAKEMAEVLKEKEVPVSTLFFPKSEGTVNHEYQFELNTKRAEVCYQKTLAFLDQTLNNAKK